jgi:hypothetical protein
LTCILGALAYCTAVFTIPGPLQHHHSYRASNVAWYYAAGVPVLQPQQFPTVFGVTRRG